MGPPFEGARSPSGYATSNVTRLVWLHSKSCAFKGLSRIPPIDGSIARGNALSGRRLLMINIDHFEKYRSGVGCPRIVYTDLHIPPDYVVERVTLHRKPPEVRICRLRNQSRVGTVPPSTSTPQWLACCARR
jgi:hypothetical protein